MSRSLALVILLTIADSLAAQPPPPAMIEQFDGKTLSGWEIDGESVVEKDGIKIGGKAAAKLHLKVPLGDRMSLRMEHKYTGFNSPTMQWHSGFPVAWQIPQGSPDVWAELTINLTQGSVFGSNYGSHTYRTLEPGRTSNGGLGSGSGPLQDFTIIVQPNTTLTIRRIALYTTPVAERSGIPWAPLIVLAGVILGVVALGQFLNRRRTTAADAHAAG